MPEGLTVHLDEPDQKFLFYSRRIIPPVSPGEIGGLSQENGAVFLILRADLAADEMVKRAGFGWVLDFKDGKINRRLFKK
jgi:hypothetical protein